MDFTCISQLRSDFWKKEADHPVKVAHERKERAVGVELGLTDLVLYKGRYSGTSIDRSRNEKTLAELYEIAFQQESTNLRQESLKSKISYYSLQVLIVDVT